jgi:hypothetical protein
MTEISPSLVWRHEFDSLYVNKQGPLSFLQAFPTLRIDERCNRDSLEYYQFLRFLAWHGQRVELDGPSDQRAAAAANWTRAVVAGTSVSRSWIHEVIRGDERFYCSRRTLARQAFRTLRDERAEATREVLLLEDLEIKPREKWERKRSGDWKEILPSLQPQGQRFARVYSLSRLTPIELELAFTTFDWWYPIPRFAPWLFYRPELLPEIHGFLLRTYSFEMLDMFNAARHSSVMQNRGERIVIPSETPISRKFTSRKYDAGEFLNSAIPLRLLGVVGVGFLSSFAVDALQHVIWFGPWLFPIVIALVAGAGTYLFALVDVFKQNSRMIVTKQARGRAVRLCLRLWTISFVFSLVMTLLLFWPWSDVFSDNWFLINSPQRMSAQEESLAAGVPHSSDATPRQQPQTFTKADAYLEHHPLQTLIGKTDGRDDYQRPTWWQSALQCIVSVLALASLSSLLGITVQWLWEDKSAMEPI